MLPSIAMATIGTLLEQARSRLAKVSDSPRLESEILLAHALGKERCHLHAWPEKTPIPSQREYFEAVLEKRARGFPIAYLTGVREFWSREFLITPDVLIPRPETELLVEIALELLFEDREASVADLGTGSGAIAVTIALERPKARVAGADISEKALGVAARNAATHNANNVEFFLGHWLEALPAGNFDLIVSNPPYIAENDPHLQQGDVRFEPKTALVSGKDGLCAIRAIARETPQRLSPGGHLLFEHGYDQADAVGALLHRLGYRSIRHYRDLQGRHRATLAQHPGAANRPSGIHRHPARNGRNK